MDEMTLTEAVDRLDALRSQCYNGRAVAYYEDGDAISVILKELRSAINCPSCNGNGRRWYSFIGDATCEKCKGSGKR